MKIKSFLLLVQKITDKKHIQTFTPVFYLILLVPTIFGSILIIGQIAIMVSGEPGNAISNLHLFDSKEKSENKSDSETKLTVEKTAGVRGCLKS